MYNQNENKLEGRIFDRLSLPMDIFPEIIMPGEKIGNISKNICSELEMETIPVIAPATHDTASAVAGIPVVSKNKSWAFISMGTWCIIGLETVSPIINDRALNAGFSNEGGVENLNLFIKNTTGLWIIQQCRKKWIKDSNRDISWDEIVKLSTTAEPFKSFINVDDPIFSKPQLDMPETIIKYCKEKGQNAPQSIGEISRYVYESLAMRFRYNLNELEKLTGKKIELIYLVGGGIQNKLLCQWIANATGVQAMAGPIETTSVGNLLMQLKASGEIKTLDEGREISLNSSEIIDYEPEDKNRWTEEYSRYLKIL
jgi:sugar (pentulose or hexulose) kinase